MWTVDCGVDGLHHESKINIKLNVPLIFIAFMLLYVAASPVFAWRRRPSSVSTFRQRRHYFYWTINNHLVFPNDTAACVTIAANRRPEMVPSTSHGTNWKLYVSVGWWSPNVEYRCSRRLSSNRMTNWNGVYRRQLFVIREVMSCTLASKSNKSCRMPTTARFSVVDHHAITSLSHI